MTTARTSRTKFTKPATPSAPLTPRGAKTRATLVKAARYLFERRGYLDTNVGDIAQRARTAHGTFYIYFSSKEEIFSEVVNTILADFKRISHAEPPVEDPNDIGSVVERQVRGYLRAYTANAKMMAVIEQVSMFNARVALVRRQTKQFWTEMFADGVKVLQDRGVVYSQIDPDYAATALGAMLDRSAFEWSVLGEPFEFERAVTQLTILACNALGVPYGEMTRKTASPRKRAAAKA